MCLILLLQEELDMLETIGGASTVCPEYVLHYLLIICLYDELYVSSIYVFCLV